MQVSRVGLAADTVLMVAKGAAGLASGSAALTADAAHSGADVLSSAVVYACITTARKPPDADHPYGHGKIESLGTLGVGLALLGTGGGMGLHSAYQLLELIDASATTAEAAATAATATAATAAAVGVPESLMFAAATVAAVSVLVKEGLYRYTLQAGASSKNDLLVASAWHHRADAASSVVALAGAGGAWAGFPLLDPLGGLVVSAMIANVGVETGYGACQVGGM